LEENQWFKFAMGRLLVNALLSTLHITFLYKESS
jgi:hypothetical protein